MTYPQGDSLGADEKLWGMLAHLLTLLGYIVTLGLGVLLAVPLAIALAIAVLVYTIIAAIQAKNGVWYELPIVGRWARNTLQL